MRKKANKLKNAVENKLIPLVRFKLYIRKSKISFDIQMITY